MDYLAQQISWYLLAAFLLGTFIGWLIGSSAAGRKTVESQDESRDS